jgi:hypothetical protein
MKLVLSHDAHFIACRRLLLEIVLTQLHMELLPAQPGRL